MMHSLLLKGFGIGLSMEGHSTFTLWPSYVFNLNTDKKLRKLILIYGSWNLQKRTCSSIPLTQ